MKKFLFFTILIGVIYGTAGLFFSAEAKSKYSREFINHFAQCTNYSEKKYNSAFNSTDTYEIKGYSQDGQNNCIYVETNVWDRGIFVTTCNFSSIQHDEYYRAMLNPDVKTSVLIRGMAFIDRNENAVYLKYYNNPAVCTTIRKNYFE